MGVAVPDGVQGDAPVVSQERGLRRVVGEAVGAASMSWVGGTGGLEFDSVRATAIADELEAYVEALVRQRVQEERDAWSDIAYEMWAVLCNSTSDGHTAFDKWSAAMDRVRDRFHKALKERPSSNS